MTRTITEEVMVLDAPPNVRDAAAIIDKNIDAKINPPRDLVEYVMGWVNKQRSQNRYGQ